MSAHHSYQTRSSHQPQRPIVIVRTQLKSKKPQQQVYHQTRQLNSTPTIQTRRILRRPQSTLIPTSSSFNSSIVSLNTQKIPRSRSAQDVIPEATKLSDNKKRSHDDPTPSCLSVDKETPPTDHQQEIHDSPLHDKVDDKIVVSSEMLILESVSSQQPAFISAGESAVDCGKNFERPTTAATATTAINLEESVGRLLAKSKAPPLDFVDQSVVNCGDKRSASPHLKRQSPAASDSSCSSAVSESPEKKARSELVEVDAKHEDSSSGFKFDFTRLSGHAYNNQQLIFGCDTCKLEFETAKMLQQHNQSYHADKNYVCEICSKAFRFRSNLAEHRSVHTALKPFVCKFCGKSSRLKGNLTKHILKHHKSEQLDYIGTDEIIIKKGKKSVKDPMAIEFLEKSMIVMTPTQAQSPGHLFNNHIVNGGNSSRHSTSNLSASDGSMTPLNSSSKQDNPPLDERCFLMSLGLDAGSLDLKAESSESDSSVVCGGSSTTNDQLLEKCNLFMGTAHTSTINNNESRRQRHDEDEEEDEEMPDESTDQERVPPLMNSAAAGALLFNALTSMQQKANGQQTSGLGKSGQGGAAAMKGQKTGSFLDGLAAGLSNAQQKSSALTATPRTHLLNGGSSLMGATSSGSKATTCPECGKHVRKPRDLITHLAMIHGIAPGSVPSTTGLPFSSGQNGHPNRNGDFPLSGGNQGIQADLRHLLQLVLEMKSSTPAASANLTSQVHKVEQLVSNIDSRVGRLEKQLEMALNSIYTLVQLQTGINSQLSRFREDTNEQLKNVVQSLQQQEQTSEEN